MSEPLFRRMHGARFACFYEALPRRPASSEEAPSNAGPRDHAVVLPAE